MPLIASLKKTEEPASTFSDLTNITISIPQLRRSNPKCNGKKNFVLDELLKVILRLTMTIGSNVKFVNNGIMWFVKILALIVTLTDSLNAAIANKAM